MPQIFELTNQNGLRCEISSFGATLVAFSFTKQSGEIAPLILSYADREKYIDETQCDNQYIGKTIGRFAGRIRNAEHPLIDKSIPKNEILLHSGKNGISFKNWECVAYQNNAENSFLTLRCHLNSGEDGFVGDLNIEAKFELTLDCGLEITYKASTQTETLVNLTNHAYFNLGQKSSILTHSLQLNAKEKLMLDEHLVPTGEIKIITQSTEDYLIERQIQSNFTPLDTVYRLEQTEQPLAQLSSKETNISLAIFSNQPICIVYTPLNVSDVNFEIPFPAICFETQGFPDCMNHGIFPKNILRKGDEYVHWTRYAMREIQKKPIRENWLF
jgi:aldose 1-epimerase